MEEIKLSVDKSQTVESGQPEKTAGNIPHDPAVDPTCEGKVNYHGPPTFHSSDISNNLKGNEVDELRRKDEQISRLLSDVQLYVGKIKGYQTLGHLYQEAKQECARYKQKNEELANKLDMVMRRLLPEKDALPGAAIITSRNDYQSSFAASIVDGYRFSRPVLKGLAIPLASEQSKEPNRDMNHEDRSQETKDIGGDPSACVQEGSSARSATERNDKRHTIDVEAIVATESEVLSFREHGRCSKSPGESSVSSPSFVCIGSSGLSSADRTPPIESLQEGEVATDILNRPRVVDHATDINMLDDCLNDSNSSSEFRAMAEDLQRVGVRAARIEKQARIQQVLLNELQNEKALLIQELITKQKEYEDIRDNYSQALTKLRLLDQDLELTNSISNGASLSSTEWVEVEKQKEGKDHLQVETVKSYTMTEKQLRSQIQKLQTKATDLDIMNQKLSEGIRHSDRTNMDLMLEVECLRGQLDNNQQNDLKRQQEFDTMLLASKKQREELEIEKEDAVRQQMLERKLRIEKEDQCLKLMERVSFLDEKIWQMERQASVKQVEAASVKCNSMTSSPSPSSDEQKILTELAILQQQVTIYKEDFDHERRDREKAQSHMAAIKVQLDEAKKELDVCHRQISLLNEELRSARSENSKLKGKFYQAMDELKGVKTQLKPVTMFSATPPCYHYAELKWTCRICTFENPAIRSSCEMCGYKKQHVATSGLGLPLQESGMEFTGRGASEPTAGRGASAPTAGGNYFNSLEEDKTPHLHDRSLPKL